MQRVAPPYVEAILRVCNALGRRDNIHKARIKILIRDLKPETFIDTIEQEFVAMSPTYGVLDAAVVEAVANRFKQPPFDTCLTGDRRELDATIASDG